MENQKHRQLSDLRDFIVNWNNKYPHDYNYRKKHNIIFNSEEHRNLNQIDIFIDHFEDTIINKFVKDTQKFSELKDNYKKTRNYLIDSEDSLSPEEQEELFKKIKLF